MRRTVQLIVAFVLIAGGLVVTPAIPVAAAGVVGDSTPESCTEAALNVALTGGGLVTFDCGPNPVTITLTSEKVISTNTQIDGGGLVTLSGGDDTRIFLINGGASLDLSNITLSNGNGSGGFLTGLGGAILKENGTLTITNTTISGNSASLGGAIANLSDSLTITNTTISGNSAPALGAIAHQSGVLTITNSTFSGNSGTFGAAIRIFDGTGSISHSTFSGNVAPDHGVIDVDNSTLSIVNSIVANSTGANCHTDGSGAIISLGGNISDDASCNLSQPSDLPNTDPLLAQLADYGGPTETHLPLPTSPAIDNALSTNCPPTDQRGVARPVGTSCDSGSVEVAASDLAISQICVDRLSGIARMHAGGCARSETSLDLLALESSVTGCVNRITGVLRFPASECTRYETEVVLPDDGPVSVCVNRITRVIRVSPSGACSRYEQAGFLVGGA